MSRTCCRRRSNSFPRYNYGYTRPIDDEFRSRRNLNGKDEVADDMSRQGIDDEEIWDEEDSLAQELQHNCDDFSIIARADVEEAWVRLLARRALMMEEAILKARIKEDSRKAKVQLSRVAQIRVSVPFDCFLYLTFIEHIRRNHNSEYTMWTNPSLTAN